MASYLHDIGMSPAFKTMQEYRKMIFGVDSHSLSARDQERFLHWIAENYGEMSLPLDPSLGDKVDFDMPDEILTYFARDMHNDWSESWIRQNLMNQMASIYPAWVEDLVILCQSHHFGLSELKREQFDARMVGSPDEPLNLRFLAALLRVADVLEFDPKRTPIVILEHRGISSRSRVYWHKDHDISLSLERNPFRMLFTARTGDAVTHKAVLDTARMVDNELQLCAALQHESAFQKGVIREDARWYTWPWYPRLILNVRERDENFVYIDGAFKPDARHVLELLSGSKLYGSPFAAVRELLQNAFDAVREQIAYQRLLEDNPADADLAEALARLHHVELTLAQDGGRYILICSDTGVGMTKSIIERHLLVGGSPTRAEVRDLERRAQKQGFTTGRTGRFGIGVLSYFMLADAVTILTRRSEEAGADPDRTAWRFTTEGVGAFGQLTRATRSSRGTDVYLRIREDMIGGDVEDWFQNLRNYVSRTLVMLPCRFELRSGATSDDVLKLTRGWTNINSGNNPRFNSRFLEDMETRNYDSNEEFLPNRVLEERERAEVRWTDLRTKAVDCIKFSDATECMLANGVGKAQILLPYFLLPKGPALFFADTDGSTFQPVGRGEYLVNTRDWAVFAWRGFSVGLRNEGRHWANEYSSSGQVRLTRAPVLARVNFESDCEIAVHRETMRLGEQAVTALSGVQKPIGDLFVRYFEECRASPYASLSRAVASRFVDSKSLALPESWNVLRRKNRDSGSAAELHSLSFPAAEIGRSSIDEDVYLCPPNLIPGGCPYDIFGRFQIRGGSYFPHGYSPFDNMRADGVIIVRHDVYCWFAPVWNDAPKNSIAPGLLGDCVEFPPEFAQVVAVETGSRTLLNSQHPLVVAAHSADPFWLEDSVLGGKLTPEKIHNISMSGPRSAAWMVRNLFRGINYWNGLHDTHPEFFQETMAIACGLSSSPLFLLHNGKSYPGSLEATKLDQSGCAPLGKTYPSHRMHFEGGLKLELPASSRWLVRLRSEEGG